jgi:hypothetical protein
MVKIHVKKERETPKAKGGEWGNCRYLQPNERHDAI